MKIGLARQAGQDKKKPPPQLHVAGDLIQLQLVRRGKLTEVANVAIEGNASLAETKSPAPGIQPLSISGATLRVKDASSPRALAVVGGEPAVVKARGMTMTGSAIHLDRGANRLWIDGAGSLAAAAAAPKAQPASRSPGASSLSTSSLGRQVHIAWKGGMDFDGLTVRFRRDVKTRTETVVAESGALTATLSRRIDFAKPADGARAEVRQVAFSEGVVMERRTFDSEGLAAIDQWESRSMSIDNHSGKLFAAGPGWAKSVRYGSPAIKLESPVRASADNSPPADASPQKPRELSYWRVEFQQAATGNVNRRELQFHSQVKAIYGPVSSWDQQLKPDRLGRLGKDVVRMDCHELAMYELRRPQEGLGPLEVVATGNTVVEGDAFTARAHRISYDQAKDQLVLDSDGRSSAELFRQAYVGGPVSKAAARKILFWPRSNRMEIGAASYLGVSGLGDGEPRERKPR